MEYERATQRVTWQCIDILEKICDLTLKWQLLKRKQCVYK
jgi:hypothetical protein